MKIETCIDAQSVADKCANIIADHMMQAINQHAKFTIAFSGGSTPIPLFQRLSTLTLPWDKVHIFQVDERVAPDGDENRNYNNLKTHLLDHISIPPAQVYAMQVATLSSWKAAETYETLVRKHTGTPPCFDLIHLGLGEDGHTASLIPKDPVLKNSDSYVATSQVYNRYERLTFTYDTINATKCILWQVTGKKKAKMLKRLISGDTKIPAGRIVRDQAIIVTDQQ
ncbi:MAG: 6-phosphogluconolactonase [Rhodospirillales bacterium]|jgi:6-phosphogluconolactonase|nr:6-phosphogluconolactonase [Rhodospirillales bacterium]